MGEGGGDGRDGESGGEKERESGCAFSVLRERKKMVDERSPEAQRGARVPAALPRRRITPLLSLSSLSFGEETTVEEVGHTTYHDDANDVCCGHTHTL